MSLLLHRNNTISEQDKSPGLHVPVLDPNLSSQISYLDAYKKYGEGLYNYRVDTGDANLPAATFYGLFPVEHTSISQFFKLRNAPIYNR